MSATRTVELEDGELKLTVDMVKDVREALLLGLSCYGQILELIEARETMEALEKETVPQQLRAVHPTGNNDVVTKFADALTYLTWV